MSRRPSRSAVLVLGLLTALGPLSSDLYLPAFPQLQRQLHAGDAMVQLTLAGMTIGLALGQLAVGPWSDRVGRRRPLLVATALHLVASLGCALAPTVTALTAFRVLQGAGAAGGAVLVLAIARDLAEGPALMRLLARITLITTTVPLLAPVAGSVLVGSVGWRGIFAVLTIASALVLASTAAVVGETAAVGTPPAALRSRLGTVWADRDFRRATLTASMTYAGIYAYVAASPLLLEGVYRFAPRAFAMDFLGNSLGLVAGVQIAALLARRFGVRRVLTGFAALSAASAAALIAAQAVGIPAVLVALWLFVTGCGGCFPCTEALALGGQGRQAGTAMSVHGVANFAVAGLTVPVAGLFGVTAATPVALVLLATSSTALLGTALLLRSDGAQRPRLEPVHRVAQEVS